MLPSITNNKEKRLRPRMNPPPALGPEAREANCRPSCIPQQRTGRSRRKKDGFNTGRGGLTLAGARIKDAGMGVPSVDTDYPGLPGLLSRRRRRAKRNRARREVWRGLGCRDRNDEHPARVALAPVAREEKGVAAGCGRRPERGARQLHRLEMLLVRAGSQVELAWGAGGGGQ